MILDPLLQDLKNKTEKSDFVLSDEEQAVRSQILKDFALGWTTMNTPRQEFNDLSTLQRDQVDSMAFNTYQPNNGMNAEGDVANAWRCVSDDTEILTLNGWKRRGEIKVGDAVLSYEATTGNIKTDKVKEVFEYDIEGELFSIKNKHTDQLVTLNHRTLVKRGFRKRVAGRKTQLWDANYSYVEAQNLEESTYEFPLAGNFDGDLSIGGDWAELVGWMLTDGSFDKKSQAMNISQSKPETLNRLRTLLVGMKVEFREWSRPKKDKEGIFGRWHDEHRFYFSAKSEVSKFMRELIPNRKPSQKLLRLKLSEKQRLLDGLCYGDGSLDKQYGHYATICKPYADFKTFVQTLLHLMGKVGSVAENYVALRYDPSLQVEAKHRKAVPYVGKVWSISTERSNYIAKRAGHIFITGNSNAIRPIERNKVISMAGHAAERLGFLKLDATDKDNKPVDGAALVLNSQLEWVRSNYYPEEWWLHAVMQTGVSPACIIHQEYRQVYRKHKTKKVGDKWQYEDRLDENLSGFIGTIVPTDQLFIENIFEKDIQKQRFVIWRSIKSHSLLEAKYKGKKNWEHVKQGMQFLFNDANNGFYFAYDSNLQGELGEEVLYYTKSNGGSLVTMVNGIPIGDCDAKLPREDGLYPFAKWYSSWIRDNFFYGKSTVFSVSHDANIINTLYPVLVDGAILDTMKPMKYVGKDVIGSDVIVPGMTTAMKDPLSKLEPLLPPMQTSNLMTALQTVEESVDETADTQVIKSTQTEITAYQTSVQEQQMARRLAPFMSELVGASVQLTRLVLGDILQYCTVGEVNKTQGTKAALKYKSFLTDIKGGKTKAKKRRIEYTQLPDEITEDQELAMSFDLLEEQGGMDSDIELVKADPRKIRELKYSFIIGDDVLRPKSDNMKFLNNLATLDKAIQAKGAGANVNLDNATKELLFVTNPITARDPDNFMQDPAEAQPLQLPGQPQQAVTPPNSSGVRIPQPTV